MRNRLKCLRRLAMVVFISVMLLPNGVGAQEAQSSFWLSLLSMLAEKCPWGYQLTGEHCQPLEVPAHAFLDVSGRYWECERGYRRSNNQCIPVDIPPHAYLNFSGHDWECERGYQRSGNRCIKVNVPAHAYLEYFGHDWVCKRGYKPLEDQCVPIQLPVHAHLDFTGNNWECQRGYERVNDVCQPLWVQLKALESQGGALAPSPEDRSTLKQLQNQLKQAGYDPGPIDGILGPKTVAALRYYTEAQERALAKASSTQSRDADGT